MFSVCRHGYAKVFPHSGDGNFLLLWVCTDQVRVPTHMESLSEALLITKTALFIEIWALIFFLFSMNKLETLWT